MGRPTNKKIREYARQDSRLGEGDLEMDDIPKISQPATTDATGAYVQCWMWVDFQDVDREESNHA